MSSPTDCSPCCSSTAVPVNVPGAAGSNGVDAFTTLTASLTLPTADGVTQVTASVANSTWMVPGQYLVVPGLVAGQVAVLQVVSKPSAISVILVYPAFSTNTHAGDVITSSTGVSPGGSGLALVTPVSIANGGTGAITKAAAQTALGVGQTPTETNVEGLAFSIPVTLAAIATITSMTATAPSAGRYLVLGRATVDYRGVTFGSNQTLTFRAQNTTTAATVVTTAKTTGTPTTQQFVSVDYSVFKTVVLAANDVVALQIALSATYSAGTAVVSSASLELVPTALT